jgi:uncharacterized membrane-anchored protein YjiN (DUF445 family)
MALPDLRQTPAEPPEPTPDRAAIASPIPAQRVPIQVKDDPQKRVQLQKMKRRATALLVLFSVLFVISSLLESRWPVLGWLRALSEAAMVGGLADWFAITALFRHPLGIPIPHTAIIPQRKDRIGRSLGGFVQNNFLSRDVISARLQSMRVAERAARWLATPANARSIARHVASGLSGAAQVLRDEDVQALIDRSLIARLRRTQVAPALGKALSLLTAGNRHQELLDEALRLVAEAVTANEELIRQKIREESPWWIPERVDDRIHDKIVNGIENTLRQVSADPDHPLRGRFDEALEGFIQRLRSSPDTMARAEAFKEDLLDNPAVQHFSASLWTDAKAALVRAAERGDEDPPGAIEHGLVSLGTKVVEDPVLLQKVETWMVDAVLYVVDRYREEVGQLIIHTVGQWDAEETTQKIELQIGKDLQFVRINGTLVGGLVGLLLYAIGKLV